MNSTRFDSSSFRREKSLFSSIDFDDNEHHRSIFADEIKDRRRYSSSSLSSSSSFDEMKCSSLITMIYHGENPNEILVFDHQRIVFKGCLEHRDKFRFKISDDHRDDRIDLKFYLNNRFRCRWTFCCEFRLFNEQNQRNEVFQIENIFGTKSCRKCEKSKQRSTSISSTKKNPQREKTPSEGFRADLSEVCETHLINGNDDEHSLKFEPIQSPSTEEKPTKKRIYGPPQLSTMLSINEPFDSSYSRTTNEIENETVRSSFLHRTDSIRIEEEKQIHQESDENEENPTNDSSRFLRSISSHISTTNEENPRRIFHRTTSIDTPIDQNATQTILTRLGITRHEQIERNESSSNVGPRQKGNVENFILFYLNNSTLDKSSLMRIRSIVNFVQMFYDIDECLASINSFRTEKLIIITSNSFAKEILSRVEDLQQLFFIYIFKSIDDQTLTEISSDRIRGIYSTIDEICEDLSNDIQIVLRDLVSYVQFTHDESSSSLATFVYSSLINEILLNNDECESAMKELIYFARYQYENNQTELDLIDEFQSDYQSNRAIWWFTRPCFISKMLCRAFQTPDLDILYRFRSFIQHLRNQIENESSVDSDEQLKFVYLGQTIHQNDFDELNRSKNTLTYLYFNQFISGTSSLDKAIEIAENLPRSSDDFIPMIIHLDISNQLNFANRSSLRYLDNDNNDVLLNIGIIGRIVQIEKNSFDDQTKKNYASIHLQLVQLDKENQLKYFLKSKREEILVPSPLISLVKLMLITNQIQRAAQFVESIYNDETNSSDPNIQGSVAASCHLIGSAAHQQGDFQQAVDLFHLSLKTFLRFVEEDSVQLSPTYNNIGSMYFRQEQYDQSLFYHNKALQVQLNSSNPNLNSIASYSNNIGVVHLKQGEYQNALKAFHRSLKVLKQLENDNQSDIASTHDNLGDAYLLLENYEQSLVHYRQALQIQQTIQPINHQALASFNNSLGNVYNKLQRFSDALTHFQQAVQHQKEFLSETHPTFASLYNNIGSMFYRQELYAEALPYYLKSLEIELMVLPSNHPTIAVTHFNIATTYTGLGKFEEAIISTERSIEQLLKTLPEDHPEVAENRAYIDVIRKKQMLKGLFQPNSNDN